MRVAIVSTGLEHVPRGIEAWARTAWSGLRKLGVDALLYKGSGKASEHERVIRGLPRGSKGNALVSGVFGRLGGWRYGLGWPYQVEQTTFYHGLMRALREDAIDIVHLQDPWLAWLLEKAFRRGRLKAPVVLAHGTEEPLPFLRKFSHLQELSPHYLARHSYELPAGWTRHALPNPVDAEYFKPGNRDAARRELGLSCEGSCAVSKIVLSVGALNKSRKRMDWLIREFSEARLEDAKLLLVGAVTPETADLVAYGRGILGDRLIVRSNISAEMVLKCYQAADIFVLCALEEIFGIVFLEAMSCGLPCLGHTNPVTEWILDDAGRCVDMKAPGALATALMEAYSAGDMKTAALAVRGSVVRRFDVPVVAAQYRDMYREILGSRGGSGDG